MSIAPSAQPFGQRRAVLGLVALLPLGRVTTLDVIAREVGVTMPLAATWMASLTEDERDSLPWHRVVAKGGAIGRGPWRDQHIARLMREGVAVSPAGVVQDLGRIGLPGLDPANLVLAGRQADAERLVADVPGATAVRVPKSRGMHGRPDGGSL